MPVTDTFAVTRYSQVGVEATVATAVAATKKLRSFNLMLQNKQNKRLWRPTGHVYNESARAGRGWSEFKLEGDPQYEEIAYPLSGLLGQPVITTPGGGTNSRQSVWTAKATDVLNGITYTLEQGDAVRAQQVPGVQMTDFEFSWDADYTQMTGAAYGVQAVDPFTLTASLTSVPIAEILGADLNVFLDTTAGGIGGTQITDLDAGKFGIGGMYGKWFANNRANKSWAKRTQLAPTVQAALKVEANTLGWATLWPYVASDQFVYVDLNFQGPIIEGSIHYQFDVKFAAQVMEPSELSDDNGLLVMEFPLEIMHDATLGYAYKITAVNTMQSL